MRQTRLILNYRKQTFNLIPKQRCAPTDDTPRTTIGRVPPIEKVWHRLLPMSAVAAQTFIHISGYFLSGYTHMREHMHEQTQIHLNASLPSIPGST